MSPVVTSERSPRPNPFALAADLLRPQAERLEYATPGELARAINPQTIQTPALEQIDHALVDVADGACNRLIISMPPQEGKSSRVTHYGVLWMLRRNPNLRVVVISYGADIARRWSYLIRAEISAHNGADGSVDLGLRVSQDSRAAGHWTLAGPARGSVDAMGLYGSITGMPVDLLVIDDPVKDFRAADSLLLSEQAWQTYMSVARPRLAPGAPVIVILTRWHENDLAGRLLQKQADDEAAGVEHFDRWRVLNIPAQADYDPQRGQSDPLGRLPGEFMVSARGRTNVQWEATKSATAPRIWTALYQGRPSPDRGDILERQWWRRYETPVWLVRPDGSHRIEEAEAGQLIQSWDMAFKGVNTSDFVVGQVWLAKAGRAWLVDQVRGRMDFTTTLTAVERLTEKWPQAALKLIEDKANGPAVMSALRSKVSGMVGVNPVGGKPARARGVSPFIESGDVLLPASDIALFDVEGLIEEATAFPNAAHDDQVDAMSQALERLLLSAASGAGFAAWEQQQIDQALSRCQSAPDGRHMRRGGYCLYCGEREEPSASPGESRDSAA